MPTFPKINRSTFELPKFDVPKFDVPRVDLTDVELPSAEQIVGCARNAAYVGVGLVVTTAERVQALQQQLVDAVKSGVDKVASVRPAA